MMDFREAQSDKISGMPYSICNIATMEMLIVVSMLVQRFDNHHTALSFVQIVL